MTAFKKFLGINNVLPPERLPPGAMQEALNCDVGLDGELTRRDGYSAIAGTYSNVFDNDSFTLAVVGTDLKNVTSNTVLHAALGATPRVWYLRLPDGRVVYSNGTSAGVVAANGASKASFGVPIPASLGVASVAGSGHLMAGDYQYRLTYQRQSDGLEGGTAFSAPVTIATDQKLVLGSLPVLAGHDINVYMTSHNAETSYYAGRAIGSNFVFDGYNKDLAKPCRTDFLSPPPAGTIMAFWRGRTLIASGSTLSASRSHQWELFDKRRDAKRFPDTITGIAPMDGGIFVGTTKALYFLQGTEFDKLVMNQLTDGVVVLGSMVSAPGELLKRDEKGNTYDGGGMVCICDGGIVFGSDSGAFVRATHETYKTSASEVAASFRMTPDKIPQYIASVIA